jgi:hypothetical protein
MNEASWKRLIDKIQENNVVPVVGSRLYVAADGTTLQAKIAARLFEAAGVDPGGPLPPFREVNEAVSRLKATMNPQDLYDAVHDALRSTVADKAFVMPAAIRQLAEIADFRLLVALTPDDLLARCLRERCAVSEVVHSPNLPTSEGKDLPPDWKDRPGEVQLLYLFGKARSAPMFAVHDEDVLEYAHNMIARGSQVPNLFLSELQQRNLLLLGCSFPDWLSRFFLRATNRKRLSENSKRSWLIEPLRPEESLTCFLSSYSKDTEVLSDTPPAAFVAELHRRWMATHGARTVEDAAEAVPQRAMFFISYSRQTDLPCAEKLYEALLSQGVTAGEIWIDRKKIDPGHAYGDRILDGIRYCRYFLPVLSQAADARREAFMFREWRAAVERDKGLNREFIVPIVVDSAYAPERYTAQPVRAWQGLDFGHAPQGVPDTRLSAKLKKLVREARLEH